LRPKRREKEKMAWGDKLEAEWAKQATEDTNGNERVARSKEPAKKSFENSGPAESQA